MTIKEKIVLKLDLFLRPPKLVDQIQIEETLLRVLKKIMVIPTPIIIVLTNKSVEQKF